MFRKPKQIKLNEKFLKACRRGNISDIEKYLAEGAELNAKGSYGSSAFDMAMGWNHYEAAQLLLDKKIEIKDEYLLSACHNRRQDIVEFLLQAGANMAVKDDYGRTLLHIAANRGSFGLVQFLVEAGADIAARDQEGNSPEASAKERNHHGIADFLRDLQLKRQPPPPSSIVSGWILTAPTEVTCVTDKNDVAYKLTEIFNFNACMYTHITRNIGTNAESKVIRFFSEFPDKKILEDAYRELVRLGGKADASVIHRRALDKGPTAL